MKRLRLSLHRASFQVNGARTVGSVVRLMSEQPLDFIKIDVAAVVIAA